MSSALGSSSWSRPRSAWLNMTEPSSVQWNPVCSAGKKLLAAGADLVDDAGASVQARRRRRITSTTATMGESSPTAMPREMRAIIHGTDARAADGL